MSLCIHIYRLYGCIIIVNITHVNTQVHITVLLGDCGRSAASQVIEFQCLAYDRHSATGGVMSVVSLTLMTQVSTVLSLLRTFLPS